MTSSLSPLALLATGVHTQPGVYALLLGSGVSVGAGVPTGWGVVQALVAELATANTSDGEDPVAAAAAARKDPDGWWDANGDGQALGYSNLLATAAPTPATRQARLAGFFEPTEEDVDEGTRVPSSAHRAIAKLVRRGYIRVILTTNFDRLMEQALADAGIFAQVLSRAEAIAGMTPLLHAQVTIIKLHGDYADLDMRNTLEELSTYPPEWDTLLDRVLDEYGLIISGWSADWDKALVAGLERTRSRRYPLYWDARSSGGDTAGRLLAQHRGTVVPAASADELFTGLIERLEALEQMSQAPLETAMAVARLKRYLPDPVRRIDLHDLVMAAVDRTLAVTPTAQDTAQPDGQDSAGSSPRDPLGAVLEEHYSAYLHGTEPLLALVTTGVFHDRERAYSDLWVAVLQRLLQGTVPSHEPIQAAQRYPALLLLRAAGIIAVDQGRDDVLLRLLTEPTGRVMDFQLERFPAYEALPEYRVLPDDAVNRLPRWNGHRRRFPSSRLLLTDLREPLRAFLPDEEDYRLASYRYEYLLAVHAHSLPQSEWGGSWVQPGEFIGERSYAADGKSWAERDFLDRADRADDDWAWWKIIGGRDNLRERVSELSKVLTTARQNRWM